ncbi:MAG: hypothetical protein QW734_02075 [Candidatus Bathyarchaeia archaeon]
MPKDDDCFVPCNLDALLNKDVVDSRSDKSVPVKLNVKKLLGKRVEISAPV